MEDEAALGVYLAKTGKPFGKITFSKIQSQGPKQTLAISRLYFNDIGNAAWDLARQYPDMNLEKAETAHHLLVGWSNQFLDLMISAGDGPW